MFGESLFIYFWRYHRCSIMIRTIPYTRHEFKNEFKGPMQTQQRPWPRVQTALDLCYALIDLILKHSPNITVIMATWVFSSGFYCAYFTFQVSRNKTEQCTSELEKSEEKNIIIKSIAKHRIIQASSSGRVPSSMRKMCGLTSSWRPAHAQSFIRAFALHWNIL